MKWSISAALVMVAASCVVAKVPAITKVCVPNESWKQDCNDCICGEFAQPMCTKRDCSVTTEAPQPKRDCEPGSIWMQSCNSCRCTSTGVGICTQMACLSDDQVTETSLPGPPHGTTCRDGQTWKQDCNTCRCVGGRAACTKLACPGVHHPEEEACTPGSVWKQDCNTCRCVGGRAACTKLACIGVHLPESEQTTPAGQCTPGTLWKESCNNCRCTPNGLAVCTMKACLGKREVSPAEPGSPVAELGEISVPASSPRRCVVGASWKDDCNNCYCTPTGTPACTKKRCIKLPVEQVDG